MADLITPAELVAARPELAGSPDLAALIAASTAAIEGYCHRPLALGDLVETFSLNFPAPSLWLLGTPVVAIASVTIDGAAVDPSSYRFDPETGEVMRASGRSPRSWPPGVRHLTVSYSAGYSPIPADLKRAAIVWVGDCLEAPGHLISERIGDYQYQTAGDGPAIRPFVAGLLRRYRRVRFTSGD